MNLETNYRLWSAGTGDKKDIGRKSRLYSLAPISELVRRGWVDASKSVDELERKLCAFLQVNSLDEASKLVAHASLRHSEERGHEIGAQIAWLKRVEHLARLQDVGDFSLQALKKALPELLNDAEKAENVACVPQFLRDLGVHFVLVPHLPKTYLDGAAFYMDGRPVVALTLRYDRVDAFWFTLAHELAHIVLRHKGVHLDTLYKREENASEMEVEQVQEGERVGAEEKAANHAACDWLVNLEAFEAFIEESYSIFSEETIASFAEARKVHPGVVLGQLQHRGLVGYNQYRSMLAKVKPFIKEWIDVPYPQAA